MINNKDIIFIINPKSGKKNISKIITQIEKNNLDYFISNTLEDFKSFISKNVHKFKVFVIVGGDGTINSAIDVLYKYPNKILAIIPTGSGNGFAKELGFTKKVDVLLEDILQNKIINIDIQEVNKEKFINIFGLGFDSYVAHDFDSRNRRGLKTYIRSVIKLIFKFKPIYVEITIGNEIIKDKFNMVLVANSAQFGNNAYITPNAKPNSKKLELALIKPFPFYYYPVFLIKLFSKKLNNSKYITYKKITKEINIKSPYKNFHIDGEPRTFKNELKINILEQKVKFIKTKKCKF